MKMRTTAILGGATLALALGAYFFDYKIEEKQALQKDSDAQIITFTAEQINFIEIQKKNEKIVLQKNETGWMLLEPIQDKADSNQVEELVKVLSGEKMIAVAKDSVQLTNIDLKEFGLDDPAVTYNFKNNAGNSKKIVVGTQKNFEGNSFVRLNSDQKVLVANSIWLSKAENNLLYYREKRLYRHSLGEINHITAKSLQDQFELKKIDSKWVAVGHEHELDQNKVREMLKKISETSIQEYVFEGEPSNSMLKQKGLVKSPVQLKLETAEGAWSVEINQSEQDKALFAVTDRPTMLVRLDITEWEFFGNLSLDNLRDRITLTRFNLEEVKKVFYKANGREMSFVKEGLVWKPVTPISETQEYSETELVKTLNRIHDLEISEFVNKGSEEFKGSNMVILQADSNRLVYQLNWGPELKLKRKGLDKDYYYARTQIAPQIFAVEKAKLDAIGFAKVIQPKTMVVSTDETQKEESAR